MKQLRLMVLLLTALAALAPLSLICAAPAPRPAAPAAPSAAPPVAGAPEDLVQVADEVARDVEALRGWQFKTPVRKKVATPAQTRAYLQREIEKQCPPGKVEKVQAFLRTVGLLPRDCELRKTYLDLLQEQAGGYYDTDTQTLCMVNRGGRASPFVERIMMSHELTHALDDQQLDLDKFIKPLIGKTEDMDLVVASVMEGSATSLMMQYMTRAMLSGRFNPLELQSYAEEETQRSKLMLSAPRYFTAMLGAYLCGMQFLAKGNLMATMLSPDNRAIGQNLLAATKDSPRSTEQILHPDKYWNPSARDDPIVVNDDAVAKLLAQPGRWIVHQDTVGEMLCAMLTTPADSKPDLLSMQMADSWTTPGASGWGGDRFYLLASGPNADVAGKTLRDSKAVWFTLWDTPADRDEFIQAYEKNPSDGPRALFRLGNLGAVVFFGFDDAGRKALEQRIEKSPPPMLKGGKPWSPWAL